MSKLEKQKQADLTSPAEQQMPQAKKAVSDLVWSIAALVLMNGTIQIVIYPQLNRSLGTEAYGNMLFLVGLATIFGAGIGSAMNNGRLLRQLHEDAGNLDYLLSLLSYALPACLLVGIVAWQYLPPMQAILAAVLALFITLRYYSDVEYRLSLNYKRYFLYYALLSAGYVAGVLLWRAVPSWVFVLLLGECACVCFCMASGKIYHPMAGGSHFADIERHTAQLMLSYLLFNAVVQMDRILLRMVMDSNAVTIFYVASLLGKIIALLVGPLNAVLVSYLTRWGKKLDARLTVLMSGGVAVCAALFYLAVCIASPFVIHWLYPDIYAEVMQYAPLANLGQVLCFAGSLELGLLLTMAPSRWQLVTQGSYAILFVAGGLIGVQLAGLTGFVYATAIAGAIRFLLAFLLLLYYSSRARKGSKM